MMRLKQLTHSILLFSSLHLQAQSGSFGNVFVHAQGEMALFSALHHFNNSGAGVLQGIVGTERTGANRFVSFVGSATPTGASDATHIDGYVRKYGVGAFTFPTGDNGKLRTCAISSMSNATESTTAAYFQANPNTAITSNLGGGNYGALPTGAPFNTSSKAANVSNLSNLEYWDVNGAASVRLTLSYDATSAIHTLTNNDLSKLTIAGWNGTQWVTIPSTVTGTLTTGTIQTNAALVPNTYNVYTFAAKTLLAGIGPGCVTAGLDFWLDPAKNVTKSGNTVTNWADADGSGNNPTLTQATVALKPEYAAGDVLSNFNPYINFAGSERLNQDVTGSNYSNNHTTFGVVNHYGTKGSYTHFIRFASATNSDGGTHSWGLGYPDIATGKVGLHYITAPFAGVAPGNVYNRVNGNKTILQNVPTLYSASLNATTGATAIGHNGNEVSATGITGLSFVPYNSLTVGGGTVFGMPDNKTQEIIHYSRELSVQERQRVQTYLAIKHGITLDNQDNSAAITEGDYLLGDGTTKAWNYTANATYHNNVFGIGREDCQGLNQKQSTSILQGFQPIIGLTQIDSTNALNPSVLTDGSFMICGSDNGATSFGTPIAPAAGVNANNRFTRIWKVQETGTVGSVKCAVPTGLGNGGTVYLVRSNDVTFNASDEFIPLSNLTVGSDNYLAANIDFNNGDYFTLATFLTTPGCVAADLKLWLKADNASSLTLSAGKVASWANGASGAFSLVQATSAKQPVFNASGLNFNPVLDFSGAQVLTHTTGGAYVFDAPSNPATLYSVSTNRTSGGGWKTMLSFGGPLDYPSLHWYDNFLNVYIDGTSTAHTNHSTAVPLNQPTIGFARVDNSSPGDVQIGYNGLGNQQTFAKADQTFPASQTLLTVGGETDGAAEALNGYLPEVVVYNRVLTDAEMKRLNTYFAVKYGVTLDHDYVSGASTTLWNYAISTTYNNNIASIGREDCQGLNQKQSKSVNANSILTIGIDTTIATSNALNLGSFNQDASFLVWGDNNVSGVITPAGSACSPPSSDKRVAKVWKVVETGSVEKVKIQADLAGMGFNANYPVYMLVADDANFVSNAAMVPMTGAGTVFSTNYDFNGTKYISFAGNTTPLANLCTGDKQLNWFGTGNWWHWGERSKTITKGDQTFTVTVADAGNNILYPSWYPVSYGNSVLIPRYDNDNTGKVTFKVTMSKPASSVSFPIYGVDWHWGIDKVTVLGKLSGGAVTPKLSKSKYSWVSLAGNEADGTNYLHGGYTFLSTAYANFDSPIDEFTIEYVKTTTYPTWKIYNYIGIGAIDVACAPLVPEVITPDNVYVFKQVTPDSAKAGEKFTFKYTIQNLNCDNKTISLSDILPASLTYVDSTLATSLPIGTVNNYGSGQNLSLSTINVPKGTSYIYVNATGSTAGTYNSQANFNVTGGGSYASDDPKQSGSNNPTRVVILASDPVPNLSIVKAVDKTTVQRDSIITYTYTITNNGAAAINTYLEDALYSAATFVSGSLANAPAGTQLGAYANTSTFLMRDLNLSAGATKIFSIKVNVGQMPVDSILKTIAKITPDYQSGYQQITTFSNAPQTQIVAAVEICNNGIDDDGDSLIDCADPDCGTMTLSSVANTNPTIASCPTLNNGTITVTATGTNLQYSKDNGTTWQVSNVFTGLVANSYTIKIRDSISNCSMNYASNPVILTAPSCGVRQINYTLRYNAALSRYELYAKPNWNSPNMSTDCHATIVVPASLPDSRLQNVIPGTDAGGAGASDVAYAPTEDPAHDFHYTTFIINSASYVAGQELFCMSFTLPVGSPAACMTGVRLYNNVSDPVNSPGGDINGGDFKNYYADVMSAADYYGSNYGVASDLTCPSTGLVVAPKAFLSGSYVSATGMMYDSLRVKSLIPIAQPYNTMGYAGTETVAPAVFATTGANAIVDWVLVQLRSDTSTVVAQQAALIQRDGDIVSTDGVSSLTFAGVAAGNYYVSVKHRNHLGVMTANALALTSTVTNIDFTIAATPNFQRGGNFGSIYAQRTFGTTRALWSGNMGGGNTVKANGAGSDAESVLFKILLDMGNTELLPTFIIYNGYFREDGNLDGKVIYQGASSETDALLFNILLHGGNGSVLANFVIYEQIP